MAIQVGGKRFRGTSPLRHPCRMIFPIPEVIYAKVSWPPTHNIPAKCNNGNSVKRSCHLEQQAISDDQGHFVGAIGSGAQVQQVPVKINTNSAATKPRKLA